MSTIVNRRSHLDHLVRANRRGKQAQKKRNTGPRKRAKAPNVMLPPEENETLIDAPIVDEEEEFGSEATETAETNNDSVSGNTTDSEIDGDSDDDPSDEDLEEEMEALDELEDEEESRRDEEVAAVPVTRTYVERRVPSLPSSRPLRAASAPVLSDDTSIPGVISIQLESPLRQKYTAHKHAQFGNPGPPLRDYIVQRLSRCQDHTAEKPIYINDAIRRKLEQRAHRNFDTAEELLNWILTSSAIRAKGMTLEVDPELVRRALDRKDPDQTDNECLAEHLTAGIEIKTGMR